jgi:hypothetical protein
MPPSRSTDATPTPPTRIPFALLRRRCANRRGRVPDAREGD